jgi:hypothetical protein
MARSKNNVVTHGLSGKVGDMLVFSQRNGKTIVSKIPNRTAPQSDAQIQHLQKFQEAVIYAKSVMADPTTKAAYAAKAQGGVTAYNVAVADLLNAPNIESINLSAYTGKIGDKIIIRATDDFKVTKVTVTITNADNSLVEKGEAVLSANGLDWVYTAATVNADLSGDKIVVQAFDLPGNLTEKQQPMV